MLGLCLSMKKEKDRGPPVVSEVCQSEGSQLGRFLEGPSIINSIFWRKGRGHISPNSPSPFLRPHPHKKVSQQLSRTSGSQEFLSPYGLEESPQQVYEDAQGGKVSLHLKQKQSERLHNYTNKKEKKMERLFFSVSLSCFFPDVSHVHHG